MCGIFLFIILTKRIYYASVRVTGNCSTNGGVSFNLVFKENSGKWPVDTRPTCDKIIIIVITKMWQPQDMTAFMMGFKCNPFNCILLKISPWLTFDLQVIFNIAVIKYLNEKEAAHRVHTIWLQWPSFISVCLIHSEGIKFDGKLFVSGVDSALFWSVKSS